LERFTAIRPSCRRPWATTASATDVFWAGRNLQRRLEDLGLQGLLAQQPLQLTDLVLQGSVLGGGHRHLPCTGRGKGALTG
jgi:hypothetical protein